MHFTLADLQVWRKFLFSKLLGYSLNSGSMDKKLPDFTAETNLTGIQHAQLNGPNWNKSYAFQAF